MSQSENGDDDGQTKSTATRWWLTNDVIAITLALSLPTLVLLQSAGYIGELNTQVFGVYATATLIAVIWAFGEKTVTALNKLRGKGK